jgi:hypothetical protein
MFTDVISFVCDERELNFIQINFDVSFTSLARNEKEEVLYFFAWDVVAVFSVRTAKRELQQCRQCTYNVTLRRVRITIVAVER